ncbi:toprim domain-containing protein [Segetibacter sp. 3557_3]|uniref:toprim domain-containing protein n=1 Tax=Segetibacter sp. 3557_3 TaxID=2547429 RepID=UPI001A9FE24F|nr:toprim domain-containing protein [Segetibacter sp. 3557_3]
MGHENERKIKILEVKTLQRFYLCRYLVERKISLETATRYCSEIIYEIGGRTYFAIGFKNDLGGYELLNPFVKLSSSPKGITTIRNGADTVASFEGFMDFLSGLSIPDLNATPLNFAVLNSLSFFESSRSFLEQHKTINLYLDRDTSGQNYSGYALSLTPKYQDCSNLYQGYKDLNEWMMHIGKGPRQQCDLDIQA